jgi:hypothetical protein
MLSLGLGLLSCTGCSSIRVTETHVVDPRAVSFRTTPNASPAVALPEGGSPQTVYADQRYPERGAISRTRAGSILLDNLYVCDLETDELVTSEGVIWQRHTGEPIIHPVHHQARRVGDTWYFETSICSYERYGKHSLYRYPVELSVHAQKVTQITETTTPQRLLGVFSLLFGTGLGAFGIYTALAHKDSALGAASGSAAFGLGLALDAAGVMTLVSPETRTRLDAGGR